MAKGKEGQVDYRAETDVNIETLSILHSYPF